MVEHSPDINQQIWQVIAQIPEGKVSTYGDIARFAGLPGCARRVGRSLTILPQGSLIPWYRVINAQGRISLPYGSAGQYRQRERLEAEGIVFRANKSINLSLFRWDPASDSK